VTTLAIRGIGVLSGLGTGTAALSTGLAAAGCRSPAAGRNVSALHDAVLPTATAHALVDFDVRAELGRKGTSFLDRGTSMAVVAVRQALADAGVVVDDACRRQIGVVLGTTVGSLKSTSDYSRETLEQDPPYLVNPVLFPNTVMNRAAGQVAIWFGLKGVNATIAGGPMAFLHVLRYTRNALRQGQANLILAGAVEEFSPHTAWLAAGGRPPAVPVGEGAVFFAVERGDARPDRAEVEVLSVVTGFSPDATAGSATAVLRRCLLRALAQAGVSAPEVGLVVSGETAGPGGNRVEDAAVAAVFAGSAIERLDTAPVFGDCQAASTALALAAVHARHRADAARDGQIAVVTAHTAAGGVGAAVVRGWSRGGGDRG
jgi:3-oxoacyl-[acyl-carrier-protein] synthase II